MSDIQGAWSNAVPDDDPVDDLHADHPCRYDRHWFGGQSADGELWFAAALGRYPHAGENGVIDGAFMVATADAQTGCIASRPWAADGAMALPGFRLQSRPAPAPGRGTQFRLCADDGQGGLAADLVFDGRIDPVAEPRYTFAIGGHAVMDLRRFTQGGRWSGWIRAQGREWILAAAPGTRDRSWGQRPIGRRPPAPPDTPPFPWFWLWMPLEFPGHTLLFHTNDYPDGTAWNRHALLVPHAGRPQTIAKPRYTLRYHPGTRWIAAVELSGELPDGHLVATAETRFAACSRLAGYNHPTHAHGTAHGKALRHQETLDVAAFQPGSGADVHVQSPCTATLHLPSGGSHAGCGLVEQMIIGPHAPSGFTGFADRARGEA